MKKNLYPRIAESLVAAAAATLFVLAGPPAHAATLNVDTVAQCGLQPCVADDGIAGCSFGEAITAVDTGANVGDCKNASADGYGISDTINLPAGATLGLNAQDHFYSSTGPTGLPVISKSVVIHGHGATLTRSAKAIGDDVIVPPDDMRLFEIASYSNQIVTVFETSAINDPLVQVLWDETTFTNGNPSCGFQVIEKIPIDRSPSATTVTPIVPYYIPCYSGGAGYIQGTGTYVSFDKTTFKDNQVELHRPFYSPLGGALFIDGGDYGVANFTNSVFTDNKAPAGGAIYAGVGVQTTVSDSTFADNAAQVLDGNDQPETQTTADSKSGGAIYSEGPFLSVNASSFFRNHGGLAGAIAVRGQTANIVNTSFFDNVAELIGGAIAAVPVPFNYRDLNGPPIPNSGTTTSGFSQFATNAFVSFGKSPNMTIQHVTAVSNSADAPESQPTAPNGGGIANLGVGIITLKSLILTGNEVRADGSGPNCYGSFVSYGTNDVNWPTSDATCTITLAAGAPADLSVDPVLKTCNPDTATPGLASCDPDTTSTLLAAAQLCPSEDQHHAARDFAQCTVGAIQVTPIPTIPEGSVCGNGQVEAGEECDLGEARNSNNPDAECRTDCTLSRCGDGIVDTASGEECEPSLDPINCQSDCMIDICTAVKGDAMRVGTGEMTFSEYLDKYDISPSTGCSPNPDVNRCQPLASMGGPGSSHANFTVSNTVCQTTAGNGGCSLSPQSDDGAKTGVLIFLALPGILFGLRIYRTGRHAYLAMRS